MTGTVRWRASGALLLAAAVETLLVALAPQACRDLLGSGASAVPVADRAGAVLSAVLLLTAAAAWTHWCLALALTAAGVTRRLLVPTAWRTAAVAALGLAVTAGPTATATADPAGAPPPAPAPARLDGLPLPDRPVGRPPTSTAPAPAPAPADVTVRSGDTLWSLAAAALPTNATDSEVDRTWRAWYAANRRAVGPDPDLLLPGQRLVAPDEPPPGRNPR